MLNKNFYLLGAILFVKEDLGLICFIYQNITLQVNLNNNCVDGHASMSCVMSCDSMCSL